MEGGVPLFGLNQRCSRALVAGLESLQDCRTLAGQLSRYILAAGGELFDHGFAEDDASYGLQIWAAGEDPVSFTAGLRAALRCLVDTPERLRSFPTATHAVPRVQVGVALAPPREPCSPPILATLAAGTDVWRLAQDLVQAADRPPATVSEQVRPLLVARPAERSVPEHLGRVLPRLGLPRQSIVALLGGVTSTISG